LEESGLGEVFEATMDVLARLERGELSPQVAAVASHLLRVALETVEAAHKLASRGEGVAPQALPPVTAAVYDEERQARVMARAAQICEELAASGAQLQLSEEERRAQLIGRAAKILQECWPAGLASPHHPSVSEAQEGAHAPAVGVRVVHGGG
jgi:hypothetical protein